MMRISSVTPYGHRRAATLTEVLMALAIASIGLVSVMSLFPIAVVRAVQATRMTRAASLRLNAEAMIDLYPQLIHNPDADLDPRLDNTGQLLNRLPPNNAFGTLYHNLNENYNENVFATGVGILDPGEDDGFANTPDNANGFLDRPNYIVDPMGWSQIDTPSFRNYFGNNGTVSLQWLRRYNGGFFSAELGAAGHPRPADRVVTLPDIWSPIFDEIPAGLQSNSVTLSSATSLTTVSIYEDLDFDLQLDPTEDKNGNGILDLNDSRVVLFGRDARWPDRRAFVSHVRTISNVNGQNLEWLEQLNTTAFQVERIRVETRQRSFTWMLTVRQTLGANPPKANVDLVVFHNRPFSWEDERPYTQPPPGTRTLAFEPGALDSAVVHISYVDQSTYPFIRKGGYVLDLINAIWYQILDFQDEKPGTVAGTPLGVLKIRIDRPAEAKSSLAIFMRGVVKVFPLGAK